MILAGDIGGTKTNLGLFGYSGHSISLLVSKSFSSRQYPGLEDVIEEFLQDSPGKVTRACFGIAGPVREGRARTPNLSWAIEASRIARLLNIDDVVLINDLEATAYGVATLSRDALVCLNQGRETAGNQAVIAAGTGLGETFLYWDGKQHLPSASEGGHTEFGPRTDLEIELLGYLQEKFPHVSYERILSGPGLFSIYKFLRDTGKGAEPDWLSAQIAEGDPTAVVSALALEAASALCVDTLDLFVSIYGAEAGNLALKTMAVGGVFVGGGIAPRIQKKLLDGTFMKAFADKGRFGEFMREIPVHVILDDKAALKGAARRAWIVSQAGRSKRLPPGRASR